MSGRPVVFFSGNRFPIYDFNIQWPWYLPSPESIPPDTETVYTRAAAAAKNLGNYPYSRLAASEFLHNTIPATCPAHLSFLELVFPPYDSDTWPLDQHPAMLDWRATVENWIRGPGGINAPALTIRLIALVMAERRLALTEDQARRVLQGYARVINPLRDPARCEGGLRALLVEPVFPSLGTPETLRLVKLYGWGWLHEAERELKELGEVEVSGGDDDSVSSSSDSCNEEEPKESAPGCAGWM